jgi:hypothetical protein
MTPRPAVFACVGFLLCFATGSAQVRPAAAGANDPTPALKNKLRQLVTAQEGYWAEHGTYTTDVAALGMYSKTSVRNDSIWVQVVQAGGRSWWGRASDRAHRDQSCVIFIGLPEDFTSRPATDGEKVKAQKEGEPICDSF